jgi:fumarylacetoacetase
MSMERNETHDPQARSFVESANVSGCDFPIQNLPFGAFTDPQNSSATLCVAIGRQVLNLRMAAERALLAGVDDNTFEACRESSLNPLMGLGPARWTALRRTIFDLLSEDSPHQDETTECLLPQQDVKLVMPVDIRNYTDFYASVYHATRVGELFRPDNPLLPNYKWVPIGYHGRASTVVVSGSAVRRPWGQLKPPNSESPVFAPSRRLDYELEIGALVGVGNEMGEPIPIDRAGGHLFGFCLLNDWSARDVQAWEYQPLGPFLAKSFATSISPWVVTAEALAPFRTAAAVRPSEDPQPLPYLFDVDDQLRGGFDVNVEAYLQSSAMSDAHCPPQRISHANLRDLYWTFAQMLAHHASNGCDLRPGDLLGSGTISGPTAEARGCLLEITRGGAEPITLADGSKRTFLEDGDEVSLRAFCQRPGAARIGFGECRGTLLAAL